MSCRRKLWIAATLAVGLFGCSTAAPQVKVLGVSRTATTPAERRSAPGERTLVVFVEVVNPTQRDLHLTRMEYRMAAHPWLEAKGNVPLSREVASDSTAVVEIPVSYRDAESGQSAPDSVPFELHGRLFSLERRVERSWHVKVSGTIDLAALAATGQPIRARIAASE